MRGELILTDSLIEAPATPALTLPYAKEHIRALNNADDALIAVWIEAATSYFEEQTGRQIITATREAWLEAFPFVGCSGMAARIQLPKPPLQSIASITYVNGDGDVITLDNGDSPTTYPYTIAAPSGPYAVPGVVEPLSGVTWPIARRQTAAVKIRYVCGYGDTADDVPELARGVLCYLVAHFDTFRAAVHEARRGQVLELPYGVQMMMDGFKQSARPTQILREYAWPSFGGFGGRWWQ